MIQNVPHSYEVAAGVLRAQGFRSCLGFALQSKSLRFCTKCHSRFRSMWITCLSFMEIVGLSLRWLAELDMDSK